MGYLYLLLALSLAISSLGWVYFIYSFSIGYGFSISVLSVAIAIIFRDVITWPVLLLCAVFLSMASDWDCTSSFGRNARHPIRTIREKRSACNRHRRVWFRLHISCDDMARASQDEEHGQDFL